MNLLNDNLRNQLKMLFEAELINQVELVYFFSQDNCITCGETGDLLVEIASLSNKILVNEYEINENPELAKAYGIQLTPGIVITGRNQDEIIDYGIRFLGIPSGYEFSSLIHSIILASKRDSGLQPNTRQELKKIRTPIQLKVFVTPT